MHIASAMGTPVVAVFGGTSPEQHAPLRKPFRLLSGDASALKDGEEQLEEREGALRSILPETAYEACVEQIFLGSGS